MKLQSAFAFAPELFVVKVSNEVLSSDGGLVLFHQFEEVIGFSHQIFIALQDQSDAKPVLYIYIFKGCDDPIASARA